MIRNKLRQLKKRIKDPVLDLAFDYLMRLPKQGKGRLPFNSAELKLLRQALLSQNLCSINGKMVPALEREFAFAYGVPYAEASTSGTAAIHVALGALDLDPGDEVITAPITDLGTVIPILYQNAIPVFADIDDTYNMDPADVERKITPQTRAIIVVHLFGNPCDMDAMVQIAKRHNIPLIEDCSQAHMAKYKGRYVGTIGDIGCFSFQQSKHMTTGDGGMTITGNGQYYERMKLFADKGYARKGWGARAYLFHAPNYRMTELVGAVGLAQLKKVNAVVEKRSALARYMTSLLAGVPSLTPPPVTPGAEHTYWIYPIRVEGVDIHVLAEELIKEKVTVSAGYTGKPIYLCSESLTAKKTYGESQCPFTCKNTYKTYEYKEGLCPRAEEALEHLLCIPLDESWNKAEVERVAATIAKCVHKMSSQNHIVTRNETMEKQHSIVTGSHQTKKVRVGIIGCGQIGRWHMDSYKKNPYCELVAFADTNFAYAQKFAQEVNAKAYGSHKEMIEKEKLDGVTICSVPSTHRDIALDLLNAGVHVLCEKPLAVSVSEAEEMFERSKEANLLLIPAFKFRFYDEVLKAKELIEKGSLGKITTFRLMFGGHIEMDRTWYVRREISGGGVIIDNGPHAVDLIRYLFGEIKNVSAEMSNGKNIEVEDTAKLNFLLTNGTVGTADLSWSVPVPARTYLEIYGEDGTALLDGEGISYRFKTWPEWKRIANRVTVREAFARQVNHFVDAIIGKNSSVLSNGEGLRSQIVIEAAYESAKQNSKINVIE